MKTLNVTYNVWAELQRIRIKKNYKKIDMVLRYLIHERNKSINKD